LAKILARRVRPPLQLLVVCSGALTDNRGRTEPRSKKQYLFRHPSSVTRLIFPAQIIPFRQGVSLQSTAWRGGFWSAQAVRSDPAPPTFVVLAALIFRTLNPLTARALPSECLATQVEPEQIASSLPVRWRCHAPQRVRGPLSLPSSASPPATVPTARVDTRCRWTAFCQQLFSGPCYVWRWRGSLRFAFP
jgi:hypothetical protein